MGYGKEALKSLDSFAREKDLSKISLHVFGHNKVALSLYQNTGFEVNQCLDVKDSLSLNKGHHSYPVSFSM